MPYFYLSSLPRFAHVLRRLSSVLGGKGFGREACRRQV